MCLHCFVYLKLFYTHYSNVLISTGLALNKIQDAVPILKSKKRGEQNQNVKHFFFPTNQCFLVKWQIRKSNKCSLGVSLGTRQGGKSLLCFPENGHLRSWQRFGPEIAGAQKWQKLLVLVHAMSALSNNCSFLCYRFRRLQNDGF